MGELTCSKNSKLAWIPQIYNVIMMHDVFHDASAMWIALCHEWHMSTLLMMPKKCAVSVNMWKANHFGGYICICWNLNLGIIWKVDMTTQTTTTMRCRGRARGLVAVWEEERRARNKWLLQNHLLPRCSRAETLEILKNMVTGYAQRPGGGNSKVGAPCLEGCPCDLESIRTKWKHTSPHPQGGESTLRPPISWPQCLGRGHSIPPSIELSPPMPTDSSSPPMVPTLSPVSSSDLDTGSSGPPSLETITRPESSYEASISSDTEWTQCN